MMTLEAPVRRADMAIIGMACRFPGSDTVGQFWQNLLHGVESVKTFSEEELLAAGVEPELIEDTSYVKANGVVAGTEYFDADFFGVSPAEAELMDPQQRLFMECAWSALEDAGYGNRRGADQIGVYAGTSLSTYLLNRLLRKAQGSPGTLDLRTLMGNDKDHLTTRVAFHLDLRGPALTIQTACSTSLVAVHLASQSIASGECDMAIAGGVSIAVPQVFALRHVKGGIISAN